MDMLVAKALARNRYANRAARTAATAARPLGVSIRLRSLAALGAEAQVSNDSRVLPFPTGTLRDVLGPGPRPILPRHLSDAEFQLFCDAGSSRTLSPGDVVFRRGELGRSMFVIESGEIRLEFAPELPEKLIGAREFFGELALFIGNHNRVASAIAATTVTLHVIEHAAFDKLIEREPALVAQFMRRSFAYLVASEQRLIAGLKRRNEDLQVTLDSLRRTQTELDSTERLVQTDELTRVCNRRGLYSFLESLPQRRVAGTRLALLLVDLDRFKQINDRHGHLVGDQVLRAVAHEVQAATMPYDLPCRLGGDEFALVAQVCDRIELEARAEQIVGNVRALRFPEPLAGLRISVSIGAGFCPTNGAWPAWYSEADSALYQVKGQGGDAWHVPAGT
jgi:diguanylate cyclase (GGDEF)-like protein